jgi:hypothetical protein
MVIVRREIGGIFCDVLEWIEMMLFLDRPKTQVK